jgi:hypothetical protein
MPRIALTLLLILVPASVFADSILLTNGGFETGDLTGWERVGDAGVQTAAFGTPPASGIYHALITDAPGFCSPPFCGPIDGPYNGPFRDFRSVQVRSSFLPPGPLETLLGIEPGALHNFAESFTHNPLFTAVEGSAIATSFITSSTSAFNTLTFDYNFLTDETRAGAGFVEDLAFYVLDGEIGYIDGQNGHGHDPLTATPFFTETGYRSLSITIPTGGIHRFGVGVIDVEDGIVNSGIVVDNVRLIAVPEPRTWVLLGSGILGICLLRRKMSQT